MELEECYERGLIRKISVNKSVIVSLIGISKAKEDTIKSVKINKSSINAYLPLAYDVLREILEAVCLSKGFKVTSHICTGKLVKSFIEDFDEVEFDRIRYARNGINYYGKKIDLEQGRKFIKKAFDMKGKLMKSYLKEFV